VREKCRCEVIAPEVRRRSEPGIELCKHRAAGRRDRMVVVMIVDTTACPNVCDILQRLLCRVARHRIGGYWTLAETCSSRGYEVHVQGWCDTRDTGPLPRSRPAHLYTSPTATVQQYIDEMDHSHMDHGHMDHGMPGMDHGPKCSMNVSYISYL